MDFTEEKYWRGLINQGLIRFYLLKTLYQDKEGYGYKIVSRVEELSDGLCRPTESTIYPALEQLYHGGYVDVNRISAPSGQKPSGSATGRKIRKIYTLNEKGRSAFRAAAKAYGEIIPILRRSIML
jgi:PadR family transcriptional regulator, regulatory protein PadR